MKELLSKLGKLTLQEKSIKAQIAEVKAELLEEMNDMEVDKVEATKIGSFTIFKKKSVDKDRLLKLMDKNKDKVVYVKSLDEKETINALLESGVQEEDIYKYTSSNKLSLKKEYAA